MNDNNNKPLENVKYHTTHYACDERLKKYGGQCVGCCCVGHNCNGMSPFPNRADRMIKGREMQLRKRGEVGK